MFNSYNPYDSGANLSGPQKCSPTQGLTCNNWRDGVEWASVGTGLAWRTCRRLGSHSLAGEFDDFR